MERDVTEDEGISPPGGSRRDFLRKSAIAGGTVVFAAPVIQTIGMKAAGAQTISPHGPGDECDTQISVNYSVGGKLEFGSNGDFNGNGPCDLSGCPTFGNADDIEHLKMAVTSASWITETTVAGRRCVRFDLGALETHLNAHHVDNCSISAVMVKAGSNRSTDLVCETQGGGNGVLTVCRQHVEANGHIKDVSNVSLCLCCRVVEAPRA
jgi:hypothetical protein